MGFVTDFGGGGVFQPLCVFGAESSDTLAQAAGAHVALCRTVFAGGHLRDIVFYDDAGAWRGVAKNAYVYAGLVCCVLAWFTRRVLLSMALSLVVFYTLMYGVF